MMGNETVEKLKSEFASNKIAVISTFFQESYAEELRNDMLKQHEMRYDFATSYPFSPKQTHMGMANIEKNDEYIKEAYEYALEDFKKSDSKWYSRFFYRISTTGPNSTPTIHKIKKNLESEIFIDTLKKITNIPELYFLYAEPFIWTKGCFLGIHTDSIKQHRAVSVVIHLSKDWSYEDGGVYFYTKPDGKVEHYVPKFNTAIIADIRNEELPHGVSMVKSDKTRLSITAWFCDKPQENLSL